MFYTYVGRKGNKILHIGYNDDGSRFERLEDFEMSLAVEAKNPVNEFSTLEGKPVQFKHFSIYDGIQYYKDYSTAFPIYNYIAPEYQFINMNYPNEINYDNSKIKIWFYDIEVYTKQGFAKPENPFGEIVSIAVWDTKEKEFIILTTKDFDTSDIEEKIHHIKCKNEKELLRTFLTLFKTYRPDILCGYFSEIYDNPYLINRMLRIFPEEDCINELAIEGKVRIEEKRYGNQLIYRIDIPGTTLLDYAQLIKKYIPNSLESYSLDFVSKLFINDEKIEYEEFDNINEFYEENPQKYFEYNIQDVRLLKKLDEKLKFLDLIFSVAYMAKCNYEDVLGTIKVWDAFVYNYLWKQKIVIPPMKENKRENYAGAYVHNVKPDLYEWVVSFDLNSLYPSIIMEWNISPECLIKNKQPLNVSLEEIDNDLLNMEYNHDREHILAGNGYFFRKDKKGFVAEIMEYVYKQRKEMKKQMLEKKKLLQNFIEEGIDDKLKSKLEKEVLILSTKEKALKILLNSFYGSYANPYFRYYDIRLATAITLTGQWVIKHIMNWLEKLIEKKFNYTPIIYSDTDSVYLTLDKIVNKWISKHPNATKEDIIQFVEKFCFEKLQLLIDKGYTKLKEYVGANEQKLIMKVEKISEVGIFKAKKKYALLTNYEEGIFYHEPKLKVTGVEIKRSSTPALVKPMLEEALITLMKEPNKLKSLIQKYKSEFMKAEYNEIAFPRTANNISEYTQSIGFKNGTPIHVRGCIVYNRYIKQNNLNLPEIEDGGKIKFLYMKSPNPLNSYVISFPRRLPDETFAKYVDYEKMWEKSFLVIIEDILKSINKEHYLAEYNSLNNIF